ncbi:hypothetical protein D3C86_427470 [compost metagenome]
MSNFSASSPRSCSISGARSTTSGVHTTCTLRLTLPLDSAHTCRSCRPATPGWACSARSTSGRSISSGTPSSSTLRLSRKRRQVRGSTHRPMATAITESTQAQPVKRMTSAPAITPTEPSMSAHTSR